MTSSFLFSGCASKYYADLCQATDWKRVGFATGQSGKTSPTDADRAQFKRCLEAEVKPNYQAYGVGIQEGLQTYCQPDRAQKIGASGKDFDLEICASQNQTEKLKSAHKKGVELFCQTSGYTAGYSDSPLEVTCSNESITRFNSEFQRGRTDLLMNKVGTLSNQMSIMKDQITDLKSRNEDLERKNRDLKNRLEETQRKIR